MKMFKQLEKIIVADTILNEIIDVFDDKELTQMPILLIINKEQKMVILIDKTTNEKTIVKCAQGDEFDAYTGVCVALFKNLYGIPYGRVVRMLEPIAKVSEENDPALNFICQYCREKLNFKETDFYKLKSDVKEDENGAIKIKIDLINYIR